MTPPLEPMPGAPPHVVWIIGTGLIVMALLIVSCVVAIALWLRDEARYNGRSPTLWFVLGLIGGWVTAIIWLIIRDRDWSPIDCPHEYRTLRGNGEATPPETEE